MHKTKVIPCKKNKLKVPLFKGGIIARIDIIHHGKDFTKLTIVGSHLPSNPTRPESRDTCLKTIIKEMHLHGYMSNIIFTGDLNYRAITQEEVQKINKQEEKLNYGRKIFNKVKKMFNKEERKKCSIQTSYKNQYETQDHAAEQLAAEQHATEQHAAEQYATILHPTEQLAKQRYAKILDPIITDSLEKDQLNRSLSKNKLELKESKIEFCPTCKLTKGHSDERNKTIHYDPERVPSWCDRVLYKGKFKPIEYNSINLSNNSDHLAVYQLLKFDSTSQTDTVK
jgi:hypothetical protein